MTQPSFRPALPSDEERLGEIAYQTGFFGDSAARYFPDPHLFADLWVRPYLRGGGGASFVLEVNGRVEGYILGAVDQGRYTRALLKVLLCRVLPKLLGGDYKQPWRTLPYFTRAALFAGPHADWQLFPAHLHLNLLPDVRGQGYSRPLLELHLERLQELGVRGVQLSTTLENVAALHVYRKYGFQVVAAKRTALWTPWLGHRAVHVALAKTLRR